MGYLQSALGGIAVDDDFGIETHGTIIALQDRLGWLQNGLANERLFNKVGLAFPDEFERCLNLTCSFEGTPFGKCNEIEIDKAGFTFGIVGFTTEHLEVQEILFELYAKDRKCVNVFDTSRSTQLRNLIESKDPNPQIWGEFFYGSHFQRGVNQELPVMPDVADAVNAWGRLPLMRELQTSRAKQKWDRALTISAKFDFDSMAARGFFSMW